MRLRIWVVNGGFDRRKLKTPVLGLTQITKVGLKDAAKLQNLETLFLTDTKITKAGVAELKKALRKCRIVEPDSHY